MGEELNSKSGMFSRRTPQYRIAECSQGERRKQIQMANVLNEKETKWRKVNNLDFFVFAANAAQI